MIAIPIYHCNSFLAQMPKWQFPLQRSEFDVEDSFASLEGWGGIVSSSFTIGSRLGTKTYFLILKASVYVWYCSSFQQFITMEFICMLLPMQSEQLPTETIENIQTSRSTS